MNKKGVTAIEVVIGVLIFMIVLFFGTDIIKIGLHFSTISQTTTEVARIGSIQGGFANSKPANYPGDYVTIHDLNESIERKFNAAGIESEDYHIDIGSGYVGNKGVRPATYDYKQDFEVSTTLRYRWTLMERVLKFDREQTLNSKRIAMSEWKYNYNNWDGE